MKSIHPLSFVLGLASGLVVLLVVVAGMRLFTPSRSSFRGPNAGFQGGSGQSFNTSRMAERLGMTEEDLQKELDSGKTFQEITAERGVQFPGGGRQRGSGGTLPAPAATSSGALSSAAPSGQATGSNANYSSSQP